MRPPHVCVEQSGNGLAVTNSNRIADIDILASRGTTAEVLIEIEERECSPKKILGDVLATMLCDGFAIKTPTGQKTFRPTSATRLIVTGFVPAGRSRRSAKARS